MERTAFFAPYHFVHLPIRAFGKKISLITDRLIFARLNLPNQGIPLVQQDALSDGSAHSHP